jgi:hypothetical protein
LRDIVATTRAPFPQNAIAAPGKGILAADESVGTIAKRFAPIGACADVGTARHWWGHACSAAVNTHASAHNVRP